MVSHCAPRNHPEGLVPHYNIGVMFSPAKDVRTGVAHAERLRRARVTSERLWQTAPVCAAVCLALAAGVRWAGWPPLVLMVAGGAALAAIGAYLYNARRDHIVSDAAAAGIDARAGLGGELRSATWFAARDGGNDWVDFHVARAAARLEAVDWTALYPPVRAHRAKAATALLVIAAAVLVLPATGRAGIHATGSGSSAAVRERALAALGLPPDVRKRLEEILKAAEEGSMASTGRPLTDAEVRDLLARLTQQDLKNGTDGKRLGDPTGKDMEKSSKDMEALAERAKRASEMASLSPEVRDALSEVAEKLSEKSETQTAGPKDPSGATASAEPQTGDAAQAKKAGDKQQEASIQAVKDSNAGGAAGVIMMSSDDPKGAQEAGLGLGGSSTDKKGGGVMVDIGAALRKETIEAYKDDTAEKTNQDTRRKTERATATVAYAGVQSAVFDKGRATAPPTVPESRRAAVQTYFIRKQ